MRGAQLLFASALVAACCALDNCVGRTPAAGWSSWNVFGDGVSAAAIMGMADAMVLHGLDELGYTYVGIDCGWSLPTRAANGDLQPKPTTFPDGILPVAEYVRSRGRGLLKLGLYSEHATEDCCGGPGMRGFEDQDARFFAANGIEYMKIDSCKGHDDAPAVQYADYARIRDALNRTGARMYLNICPTVKVAHGTPLRCRTWDNVYTPLGFAQAGFDVRGLANSYLVEECNNNNNFDTLLSIVDAQHALANDSWSAPGSWIDADMLTIGCNDNPIPGTPCTTGVALTLDEQASQMSLWCVFASNLMLGSDLRVVSNATLGIIGNAEALAVNRDAAGAHGRLVFDSAPGAAAAPASPPPAAKGVVIAPCNGGAPQRFTFHADGSVTSADGACLDVWDCGTANGTLVDLFACHVGTPACGDARRSTNQVFTLDAAGRLLSALGSDLCLDIYNGAGPAVDLWQCHPAGANSNQLWAYDAANSTLESVGTPGWCLSAPAPPPPPPPRFQVFAKPLASGARAVAVFNRGAAAVDAAFRWADIALGGGVWARATVRDLWAHADLGAFDGGFTVVGLRPHATALLLVASAA